MKLNGPIIMLSFSAFRHVDRRKRNTHGQDFFAAVLNVKWSQEHGGKVASFSERWTQVHFNMFVVTSPKKCNDATTLDYSDAILSSPDNH